MFQNAAKRKNIYQNTWVCGFHEELILLKILFSKFDRKSFLINELTNFQIGCVACLITKALTDIESRRVFLTSQKRSRCGKISNCYFWIIIEFSCLCGILGNGACCTISPGRMREMHSLMWHLDHMQLSHFCLGLTGKLSSTNKFNGWNKN